MNNHINKLVVHIDIDSPIKLFNFYKIKGILYNQEELELFYKTAFERMFELFDKLNIKVTFFVVGDELQSSEIIQGIIKNAHLLGHEIENHTYSHPFGLAYLSEERIIEEIVMCNQIIEKTIGESPIGFRSPGYSMNLKVINVLEKLNFKYDTSGFWSIMNPLLKFSQNILFKNGVNNGDFGGVSRKLLQKPYVPHSDNWLISSNIKRDFLEIPLPRTNLFGMPFYNNFNLWAPVFYSNLMCKTINKDHIIYLCHIIEFMDMTDLIPKELILHPNIKTSAIKKINKTEKFISNLSKRYEPIKTRDLISVCARGSLK